MEPYTVTTLIGLKNQVLKQGSNTIVTLHDPDTSIGSFIRRHITDDKAPIAVGFLNTHVWAPESEGDYPIPTMWDFVLAKALHKDLREMAKAYRRLPETYVGIGASFAGIFLAENYCFSNLFLIENNARSAKAASDNLIYNLERKGANHNYDVLVYHEQSMDLVFDTKCVSFFWKSPVEGIKRHLSRDAVAFAAPQFFPGIEPERNSPYPDLLALTRELGVERLWLAHSYSARDHIKDEAKKHRGFLSTFLRSRPVRVCKDSLEGAVELSLTHEQKSSPRRFGFEEEKNEYRHVICASYVDFC